jgi:methylglutaconyl-CoA hydratase
MINEVQSKTLEESLNYAAQQNALARSTNDCKQGVEAFLSKKTITW